MGKMMVGVSKDAVENGTMQVLLRKRRGEGHERVVKSRGHGELVAQTPYRPVRY